MDQSSPRPSAVPRLSRLPIPRAGLHPAASRENLHQIARSQGSVLNTHLRGAPTTLKFRTSTSALRRDITDPSADDVDGPNEPQGQWSANDNTALQRPSQPSTPAKGNVGSDILGEGPMREDGAYSDELESVLSRPRPSLSERTMETLHNIPSSPAVRRRNSSFFNAESPRNPSHSSRPASSYQLDGSMGPPARSTNSRPMSSSGPDSSIPLDFRASTNTFKTSQSTLSSHTPVKRPTSINPLKTPSSVRSSKSPVSATAKQPSPNFSSSLRQQSGSQIKSGSKTVSARSLKPRASVNSLIRKPSMPSLSEPNELDSIGYVKKKKSTTFSNTSSEGSSVFSRTSNLTAATAASDEQNEQNTTPRKSSLALRDQIAKAKAAKRAAAAKSMSQDGSERPVIPADTFDFGLSDDPFNQQIKTNGSNALLRKRVSAARTDGRLNIAAMGLKEIPEEVLTMYNLESIGAQDGSWAESVDLTRFVAADNDLECISDDVFPDIDPRENANDEGNQFGGLETLDLHGNILTTLPLGLRRLELLTSLNLSNNKLNNDSLQIISKIASLRDLKIAGNKLTGVLHESIASLQNLESLDIQRNELTALPVGLAELVRLRVLNITENHFASLPFDILSQVPLIELFVAKNELSGVLISDDVYELAQLQILDITANAVTSITNSTKLSLPALHRLSCSSNRLNSLPNMSSWVSLLTLLADDNSIASIPEGFITLPKIKSVDFSGNNIKELDNNIGGMHSLDIFRISGNPLRERKFSTMTTDDLKRALRARVAPEERVVDKDIDDGAFYSAQASPISPGPASSEWLLKLGNILDRSNTESHSLNPVIAAQIAANNTIRSLELHHNVFKEVPGSIAFFAATLTTLSLAHNELTSDTFLKDDLELPVLKELNLSSNTFNSVQPLIQHLKAPQLEKLDISFNRLTFLPALKSHFPNLSFLFASNNTLKELLPESIKGLRVVDCSSNDISSLNARIGLLGGPGGLERLDVSGNRFKVPKYTILEKGTEATLAWLRDRIPAGEPTSPTEIL